MRQLNIEITGESFADVQNYVLEQSSNFTANFIGRNADGYLGKAACRDIRDRALIAANTIAKHKKMLVEMFDSNTIDPGLQRQVILSEMIEEFAVVLAPLQNFSTVFSNVPLEGTDVVDVPFFPLALDAGNSWDPTVGYADTGAGNTVSQTRPVTVGGAGGVGGAGVGANAPANTVQDRKWVSALFSSYEMSRQPYLNVRKLMLQKANQLATLIFKEFVGQVLTAANFGQSVKAVQPAAFSADDIADLWENATGRNWPQVGRSLILDHRYFTPLLKDPSFKQYLAYGSTDPVRKAKIQEAYGFQDICIVPNLATYSPPNQFLVGLIAYAAAALFATAPIMPTPEVRKLITKWEVVVHPTLGTSFVYRRFGNAVLDRSSEIIECAYGGGVGVASAAARLTSQ
jgi:hypothetical protein